MAETPVSEKPVYRTGESVAKIIAANDAAASAPPKTPLTETPVVTETVSPTVKTETATTPTETPVETTTEIPEVASEKNVSTINFEGFEEASPGTVVEQQPNEQQVINWKDAVKKADLKEVLKELGIDDFAIELTEYRKNGGDPADYLQAKFVDYNKISDEALIKSDLQKQYPTFTPQQIELMFNRKYGVSEDAEQEDREFVELQLKADAHNSRQLKISEQQKFKIPPAITQQNNSDQSQIEAQQLQELETRWFNEHEATKALMTSKRVTLNLGENGKFNFDVSRPDIVTKAITTPEVWQKLTATKTGEPDVSKLQKLVIYAADPQKFENDLVNYGKSLALPGIVEEGRNITPPNKVIPMTEENKGQPQGYKSGKVGG